MSLPCSGGVLTTPTNRSLRHVVQTTGRSRTVPSRLTPRPRRSPRVQGTGRRVQKAGCCRYRASAQSLCMYVCMYYNHGRSTSRVAITVQSQGQVKTDMQGQVTVITRLITHMIQRSLTCSSNAGLRESALKRLTAVYGGGW